jgi:hypothetical protein
MSDRRRLRSTSTAIPIFRIASLLIMLAVIGLTIYNLQPKTPVGVAVPDAQESAPQDMQPNSQPAEMVAAKPPKDRKPVADEDPKQWEQFRRDSEAILDRSTVTHGYELPAYWRVVDWVQSQSLADLKARSFPEVSFHDLLNYPGKYRGKPVRVELLIHVVESKDVESRKKGVKPKKLYELWGRPTALNGWLYDVVTPELPPGFPQGRDVEVTTTVYGYFFKLQGYQPFDAKPDARPLLAPVIIGRVTPAAVVASPAPPSPAVSNVVWLAVSAIFVVMIIGWIVVSRRRRPLPQTEEPLEWPDAMTDDVTVPDTMPFGTTDEVEHD